jgi:selenium-binding protein 1
VSALGAPDGDGPGGIFLLDHENFDVTGPWETDRGRHLHVWDLESRSHRQAVDLGADQQMVLELRPAHNPNKAYAGSSAWPSRGPTSAGSRGVLIARS